MISGLLLVDKDEGLSSFAVVRRIRATLGGVRTGHAGSLDPFATGLLPVCVGRATRLVRFVAGGAKRYRARVCFGQATDTDDATGQPLGVPTACPESSAILQVLPEFLGEIDQIPPRYSAKRVGGRRAYRLARAGRPVRLAPSRVRVDELRLLGYDGKVAEFACHVGPGTYIRALARDLGERLGGAAHLAALRRTGVGPFEVSAATRLDGLPNRDAIAARLLDPLAALSGMPRLLVSPAEAGLLGHGRVLPYGAASEHADQVTGPPSDGEVRSAVAAPHPPAGSADESGLALIAVVSATPDGWRPLVVWNAARTSE
ncbi:MAG: tRNA pseudouridine(55) synthase TruB [Acidobacteria bacterium]|nr:tRNA pseudouridine(55) synthase TruB [Acidobacteriota bacterium]MYF15530.1 tRNA pseudouridine(55) synthase TruB [Acidobacteriota bacterium]MYI96572.1 tRNA pseudouridine(55) synthase TruB [Acidobacteriota bacterium]